MRARVATGPRPNGHADPRVDHVSPDNQGRVKSRHMAPIAIRRLFRPGRRSVRVRDSHSFTQGYPDRLGGGFTEVRTIEATIRKLR